ncbi:transglutaminase domain-containing protein [Actinospongicola halichondriae]|uniref:transglutaminase domain-containing protein n=1 Tax=Actinospongicola halichondriae TaxID=3236844 RepID=UPI003D4C9A04
MDAGSLEYYAAPGRFTRLEPADFSSSDIHEVVRTVQGLLIYDVVAKPFYDVDLAPEQEETIHERDSARLLEVARSVDPRPIDEPRPADRRVGARCHAFTRLTVAFLRHAGVPARARCGFGAYFRPGWFEDHWVAEYWDADQQRWTMVDAQLDGVWRQMIGFDGDPLGITGDEFVTAGHAWRAWRRGDLDAARCGLSAIDEHGAHWIAGNLRLDLAALNKVEMLPWDVWGAGWEPGEEPTDDLLRCFDSVAELTVDPDARFAELRSRYDSDDALRMDGTVFNVGRGQFESVR